MKNFKFILILAILLPCCSRYEDGPFFSLRTSKMRITNTWKIVSVMDVTANTDLTLSYANDTVKFEKDYTYYCGTQKGTWQLTGTSDLWIDLGGNNKYRQTILRLTHKELWIEDDVFNTTDSTEHTVEWRYEECKK